MASSECFSLSDPSKAILSAVRFTSKCSYRRITGCIPGRAVLQGVTKLENQSLWKTFYQVLQIDEGLDCVICHFPRNSLPGITGGAPGAAQCVGRNESLSCYLSRKLAAPEQASFSFYYLPGGATGSVLAKLNLD